MSPAFAWQAGLLGLFVAANAGLAYWFLPAPETELKAETQSANWELPALKSQAGLQAHYEQLKKRELLLKAEKSKSKPKKEKKKKNTAKNKTKFSKDWDLVGLLYEGEQSYMLALLNSGKNKGKLQRYQIDQTLPGGAVVRQINTDSVAVDFEDELEYVFLYELPNKKKS